MLGMGEDGHTASLFPHTGAGSIFHAPLIRAVPALRLVSVVTSRAAQVREIGARPVAAVADLLADPGIELVVVASPSATHFEIARAALEAGKHLVVDKPFTLTAAEADELIALAGRKKLALSVFQNRRWDGDFMTVKRLLAERTLGAVYHFEAHYDRFRPQIRARWRELPGPGAGTLYDLGPHLVDQCLQLFGMPQAITADLFAQRQGSEAVDYVHMTLHYGKMRAILHASVLVSEPGPHFAVHGDGGSFLKYGMDPQEDFLKAGKGPRDKGWGVDEPARYGELVDADGKRRRIETVRGAYEDFYIAMADHINGNGPAPVNPADSRNGLVVIEAAMRSAAKDAPLRSSKADRFVRSARPIRFISRRQARPGLH
jgi:scyllo-inositol 2-dehydrogenase (NADP+)